MTEEAGIVFNVSDGPLERALKKVSSEARRAKKELDDVQRAQARTGLSRLRAGETLTRGEAALTLKRGRVELSADDKKMLRRIIKEDDPRGGRFGERLEKVEDFLHGRTAALAGDLARGRFGWSQAAAAFEITKRAGVRIFGGAPGAAAAMAAAGALRPPGMRAGFRAQIDDEKAEWISGWAAPTIVGAARRGLGEQARRKAAGVAAWFRGGMSGLIAPRGPTGEFRAGLALTAEELPGGIAAATARPTIQGAGRGLLARAGLGAVAWKTIGKVAGLAGAAADVGFQFAQNYFESQAEANKAKVSIWDDAVLKQYRLAGEADYAAIRKRVLEKARLRGQAQGAATAGVWTGFKAMLGYEADQAAASAKAAQEYISLHDELMSLHSDQEVVRKILDETDATAADEREALLDQFGDDALGVRQFVGKLFYGAKGVRQLVRAKVQARIGRETKATLAAQRDKEMQATLWARDLEKSYFWHESRAKESLLHALIRPRFAAVTRD